MFKLLFIILFVLVLIQCDKMETMTNPSNVETESEAAEDLKFYHPESYYNTERYYNKFIRNKIPFLCDFTRVFDSKFNEQYEEQTSI
jgi:hypothetical protein